jgi:polyisoprenoid-binding protein YceI
MERTNGVGSIHELSGKAEMNFKTIVILPFVICPQLAIAQSFIVNAERSNVAFTISNLGIRVEGQFEKYNGKVSFSETDLSSCHFDVEIDMNSLTTGINLRDRHLKMENYFDVKQYPRARFISSSVKRTRQGNYELSGDLKIKGKIRQITIPFEVSIMDMGRLFSGSFVIDRRDFNVGGNSLTLGNEVRVQLKVVAEPDSL